jgi:hypothetical protein
MESPLARSALQKGGYREGRLRSRWVRNHSSPTSALDAATPNPFMSHTSRLLKGYGEKILTRKAKNQRRN